MWIWGNTVRTASNLQENQVVLRHGILPSKELEPLRKKGARKKVGPPKDDADPLATLAESQASDSDVVEPQENGKLKKIRKAFCCSNVCERKERCSKD